MNTISMGMTRRQFLGTGALLTASLALGVRSLGAAPAAVSTQFKLVKRKVPGAANTYFAYTHANAFLPDGRSHVVARPENDGITLLLVDPASAKEASLGWLKHVDLYYSLDDSGKTLLATADNTLFAWDPGSKNQPRILFEDTEEEKGKWWLTVSDISSDGKTAIAMRKHKQTPYRTLADGTGVSYELSKYDLASGEKTVLLEKDWWVNHPHFSPHNKDWISVAHEGDSDKIKDRLWAWNEKEAPAGLMLFDQTRPDGNTLFAGHERAMFHKPGVLFVAFGSSMASPRGLYEVDFNRNSRLVSEGNRDWHCNISRDGQWAVVDTTGPHDAPGRGWENAGSVSDVLAVNMRTGARALLYRTTANRHPYHPHPHISPDGRWIVFNEAKERRTMALEIDQTALKSFLEA